MQEVGVEGFTEGVHKEEGLERVARLDSPSHAFENLLPVLWPVLHMPLRETPSFETPNFVRDRDLCQHQNGQRERESDTRDRHISFRVEVLTGSLAPPRYTPRDNTHVPLCERERARARARARAKGRDRWRE
jgi:hypothetical protein